MNNSCSREIKLLDVTLRETPVFDFGTSNIENSIKYLEDAGIDIIEIGFLSSTKDFVYKRGSTHINDIIQANDMIAKKKVGVLYTVCMNGNTYDLNLLSDFCDGVDAIRYVLIEGKFDEEIEDLKLIKKKGYKLMVQHRNILSYTDEEIIHIINVINEIKPYSYSVVDTHGSVYPQDLRHIYDLVADKLDDSIFLGFHGHDNHKLATANSFQFLEMSKNRSRVFVDGSVMGIGAGAGNANTELLALYLNRYECAKYDIKRIYDMMDSVLPRIQRRCNWGYAGDRLITGEHNCLVTHGRYLLNYLKNPSLRNIDAMIEKMPEKEKYNPKTEYWKTYKNEFKPKEIRDTYLRKIGHIGILKPIKKLYRKIALK